MFSDLDFRTFAHTDLEYDDNNFRSLYRSMDEFSKAKISKQEWAQKTLTIIPLLKTSYVSTVPVITYISLLKIA